MSDAERELALKCTAQARLGNGQFVSAATFKARFAKENGISEALLTTYIQQMLRGE